jgi:hypothetical protein
MGNVLFGNNCNSLYPGRRVALVFEIKEHELVAQAPTRSRRPMLVSSFRYHCLTDTEQQSVINRSGFSMSRSRIWLVSPLSRLPQQPGQRELLKRQFEIDKNRSFIMFQQLRSRWQSGRGMLPTSSYAGTSETLLA